MSHSTTGWVPMYVLAVLAMVLLATCSTDTKRVAKVPTGDGKIAAQCPQPRETERAPDNYYSRTNPLAKNAAHLERGRLLFQQDAKPVACANCHGVDGDGRGPAGTDLVPPPRNFTCAETMSRITDGQMFWVIENGSGEFHMPSRQGAQEIERPGRRTRFTAMRSHREQLSETDVWEVVMYIRTLQRDR